MSNFSVDPSGNATVVEDPLTLLIDGWDTLDHIMDSKQPNISVSDKMDWYFELVSTSMNYLGMLEVASAIRSLRSRSVSTYRASNTAPTEPRSLPGTSRL